MPSPSSPGASAGRGRRADALRDGGRVLDRGRSLLGRGGFVLLWKGRGVERKKVLSLRGVDELGSGSRIPSEMRRSRRTLGRTVVCFGPCSSGIASCSPASPVLRGH